MDISADSPRILIIDSYDSFTYNLADLVKKAIPAAKIYIVKNDEIHIDRLIDYISSFSAALVGPGPGSPLVASDIGIGRHLWNLPKHLSCPVFGVCLGLQSLGVEFGATLKRLEVVKHGQVAKIIHNGDDLFEGIAQNSSVVRYHSLHVDTSGASKLEPLAWANDGGDNGDVVMGLKHRSKPLWAVQYHPESVCTDSSGLRLLQNFWKLALEWWGVHGLVPRPWDSRCEVYFRKNEWPSLRLSNHPQSKFAPQRLKTVSISISELDVLQICEVLGVYKGSTDFVLLDSAAAPGTHTIIGSIDASTLKIQHFVGDKHVTIFKGKRQSSCSLGSSDIWTWLASFMRTKEAVGGNDDIPFWGGLVGYLSYELGLDRLDHTLRHDRQSARSFPDVNLVFVERSLVLDANSGKVHLQSLKTGDDDWFAYTASMLKRAAGGGDKGTGGLPLHRAVSKGKPVVYCPEKEAYVSRVKEAQEYLFAGDSYELCLTARTRIRVPKSPGPSSQSSWDLYKRLRSVNPAPYAAYMRLHPTTLVSSSPERFLSYSRPPSRLQLRPIKGTVRKGKGMTRELAEDILNSPKEIGENLMIVDLIRHDLHGVIGAGVDVKKFCGIEEYETVWQLVSVIEGNVEPDVSEQRGDTSQIGWEVLKESLPPGSMTGAPKKRSVQILQNLEGDDRSIYSGVMGYWCVSGGGDWSVIIRTLYKVEEDRRNDIGVETSELAVHAQEDYEEWFAGAGGAITALSDPEAEWDEMLVKLQSVLRALAADNEQQ